MELNEKIFVVVVFEVFVLGIDDEFHIHTMVNRLYSSVINYNLYS